MYLDVGAPSGIRTLGRNISTTLYFRCNDWHRRVYVGSACPGLCPNLSDWPEAPAHIRCVIENKKTTDIETLRLSTRAVLTRAEAASILEVDARTISRSIEAGQIPSIQVGRRVLIPKQAFLELLERGAA